MLEPLSIYRQKLQKAQDACSVYDAHHARYANFRLLIVVGVILCGFMAARGQAPWSWAITLGALFVVVAGLQWRVETRRKTAQILVDYFSWCTQRVEDSADGSVSWHGLGCLRLDLLPDEHPYALDLNLFGEASLMDRLGRAATEVGTQRLAAWLLTPPSHSILARQQAVAALKDQIDFRAALYSATQAETKHLNVAKVLEWSRRSLPNMSGPILTGLVGLLSFAGLASAAAWLVTDIGPMPLLVVLPVQLAVLKWKQAELMEIVGPLEDVHAELSSMLRLIESVEQANWTDPWLGERRNILVEGRQSAQKALASLRTICSGWEVRRNQLLIPLVVLSLLPFYIAWQFIAWHRRHGPHLSAWFDAIADIDAAAVLSHFAFDETDAVFADLVQQREPATDADGAQAAFYEGIALKHPLIPDCVPNDVRLDAQCEKGPKLLIVSGSNMAGKSTLLRSVGLNAVLAQAGAPVRARSLRMSAFNMAATLHVQDSVRDGRSRFYAELLRLKTVVQFSRQSKPMIFLLDELLSGTNSHDRRTGATALMQRLLGANAVGLLTTHDLALTDIASAEDTEAEKRASSGHRSEKVCNVHLEDHLEGDTLAFDYRLKPGVIQKSNALALMQAVGLLEAGSDAEAASA